ncbi:MAG: VCBS domain-containing protein, partial [Sphingomicrobium sp.]
MRYEDASQTGSGQVDARNDADHLAARDYGPATGNVISGTGTITGSTGLDMVDSGAGKITAIDGAGGSDASFTAGKLSVDGQYGKLSIDARGNYSYERDHGTPNGVSDVFHYTLANKAGATDIARLVINIGDLPKLATEGTRVVPGADGTVVLPAGVELSDIHIVGRDLVVTLPDGSTMIIVDGAIFVPQLVLGGVEVPATNLAALLIGSEPRPAAGDLTSNQQSSGGNFAVPVAPLDPGVPLGDLLPPTELGYTPPEFHEPGQFIKEN